MTTQGIIGAAPQSALGKAVRSIKDAARIAIGRHSPYLARRLTNFHKLDDRMFMENVILPFFRDAPEVQKLLFVGTEWYTKPYERFFRDKEYWTLEIDPDRARYGSKHHIVAPLSKLEAHAPPASFDAILCNGIFHATAITTPEEAEPAFAGCFRCLKPGGWFLHGWDDSDLLPYPVTEIQALKQFEDAVFPPIGTNEHHTNTEYRHIYNFYKRPL